MNVAFLLFYVSLFGMFVLFAWGLHYYQTCKLLTHKCDYFSKQWGRAEEQLNKVIRSSYPDDDDEDEDEEYEDEEYNQIMNPDAWKTKQGK